MTPFFSIVSVTYNDVWALMKTARSVFRQTFKDFEYLVIDGASTDGTLGLVEFWQENGLVSRAISEPDSGVYHAMNKGARLANGQYVCFLNAGDVFASDDVLVKVHELLQDGALDGCLGWGELNHQIWASWIESEAFKLSSLGFCHQSLFIKRPLLVKHPFDERPFKTDSDTLQLGRMYAAGARIPVIPEVLAIRGGEPGISANTERTKASIVNTIVEEYPPISEDEAERIISFRRKCEEPLHICNLLKEAAQPLRAHLACMVLDTLFLRQSSKLSPAEVDQLYDSAGDAMMVGDPVSFGQVMDRLLRAQDIRQSLLDAHKRAAMALQAEIATFDEQEASRIAKVRVSIPADARRTGDFVVSLTSFPARISTLRFVIQSLMEQTCRPREIHLWLGADEIPNRNWLPKRLLKFEEQGLRIHFARRTFHQYDKFMHNSALNASKAFVIVDDDIIYPPHSMASLLEEHSRYPNAVVANRCHLLGISTNGEIEPYREWKREFQFSRPSLRAFPTGAGGVLYPVGFLSNSSVTNLHDILAHAPYADDIWLKACALAQGIPAISTPLSQGAKWYLRYTPTMRSGALHATNVDLGLNDMQITRIIEWLSKVRPGWRQEILADSYAYSYAH